jgi:Fanconi-associated nuclease 1
VPQGASPPRARLVEVKGPGDRLSDRQRVWIDVLLRHGADVAVCYVER